MHAPIRVFVGSGPELAVQQAVVVRSLLDKASGPIDVDIIDCGRHLLHRIGGDVQPLPEEWRGRLAGGTVHSFARFAPPELCGYEGRAIYLEPDQVVFGDIAELWDLPLDGRAFAAVPSVALRGDLPPYQLDGYLSSVLVFDCARCRPLSVVGITDDIDAGHFGYADAISLTDACLDRTGLEVAPLSGRWNDLERHQSDTRLLHYTDGARQPWRHPRHPAHRIWTRRYLATVDDELIDDATLDSARELGQISTRVRALPRLPRPLVPMVDAAWQRLEALSPLAVGLAARTRRIAARTRRIAGRIKARLRTR